MKYTGLDLFAGCGGLSIGAEQAGIDIVAAVEKDKYAAETYINNHPDARVYTSSIETLNPKKILEEDFKGQNPFIIMGGPPCQGFSLSNCQTRDLNNKKNYLFKHFIKFVKVMKPQWILFENVEGLKSLKQGLIFTQILNEFLKLNYQTASDIINAADYGVPQLRKRLFIICWQNTNIKFTFPEKIINNADDYFTVYDAISDLPDLENGNNFNELQYKENIELSDYQNILRNGNKISFNHYVSKNSDYVLKRYRYIKQGKNWKCIPKKLMKNYKNINNCHSGIYHRLDFKKPSVVIGNYRKNMLIHPTQDRGLSVREAARIQSFPDDYIFYGTLGSQQQQVGNAVPPVATEKIIKEILRYGG